MTKKILLILTILCFYSVHAQYDWTPAKVILKDGTSFRGLVKFPLHSGGLISIGSTAFKYKKNKKSPKKKYGSDSIEEVIFGDEDFTTVHYKYVPIKKKKSVLMELVVRGRVNLYTRSVLKSHNMFTGNSNFPSTTTYYEDSQFYFKRNNEQTAKLIAGPNSFGRFISKAKDYFSDCSKIVDYLENRLYDLNNLIELVDDYNLLCD
jgi:hypothetical protein